MECLRSMTASGKTTKIGIRKKFKENKECFDLEKLKMEHSELSNKRRVCLILFEKIFPTRCFFSLTQMKKKSQLHVFSST